jgi:hypothetical protein
VLQECRTFSQCSTVTWVKAAQVSLPDINRGFTRRRVICRLREGGAECHGSGRFAAHFRPTHRLIPGIASREREWVTTMPNASATAAKKTDKLRKSPSKNIALQLCYGQIGISAVAAAVRYQGGAKNLAYAPVAIKTDDGTAIG